MTKEEYISVSEKICNTYECNECPLRFIPEHICGYNIEHIFGYLNAIENWAKEHPKKTNRDKFEEVFGIKFDTYALCSGEFSCDIEMHPDAVKCIEEGAICADCRWWDEEYKER